MGFQFVFLIFFLIFPSLELFANNVYNREVIKDLELVKIEGIPTKAKILEPMKKLKLTPNLDDRKIFCIEFTMEHLDCFVYNKENRKIIGDNKEIIDNAIENKKRLSITYNYYNFQNIVDQFDENIVEIRLLE